MTQFITAVAALLLVSSASTPTTTVTTPPLRGPAWISVEYPANPYDAATRDAFLTVHAYHHGTSIDFPVSGTAEGIVNGERRSIALAFTKTSRPGVFALKKQWRDDGVWSLVLTVTQGKDDVAQAVVDIAANGTVASVRVPTKQQGAHTIPAPIGMSEVDKALKARATK